MRAQQPSIRLKRILPDRNSRCGHIAVLAAAVLVMVFGFAAFAIDVGFLTLTKTQIHAAADAGALAAGLDLRDGLGLDASQSSTEVDSAARASAVEVAALHQSGDLDAAYVDSQRDVRFGQFAWDDAAGQWQKTWGVGPYNLVEVTLHRDQTSTASVGPGDQPVPLFFAPVIGHESAGLEVTSTAAYLPGIGFRIVSGNSNTAGILPITYDMPSWEAMLNGGGSDDYSYNPATGQVSNGSDGIREVNIYPEAAGSGNGNGNGSSQWTPGNRGTVDLGNPNNSTADLSRQILYGLSDDDLSYFNGEISFANGPLLVNGDTGISAGIKNELAAIIGQPRAIPLFTAVTGQGNNTMYTIVKFVGVRLMYVKLTGGNKKIIAQPATLVDPTVVPGDVPVSESSVFAPVRLVQ